MVVKSAAKDVPMMTSKSMTKDLYNQNLSAMNPNIADTTDYDIMFNVAFSLSFGSLIMGLFLWIRPKFLRLYSSNNVGAQRPVLPGRKEGRVAWIRTVLSISNVNLLAWAGLDGFLYVQVVRLMALLSLFIGAPLLLLLAPLYFWSGPSELSVGSYYFKASILNCPVKWLWVPAVMSWLTTAIFCYVLYVFYGNFVRLRQAYLKDPSALTCAATLQRLVRITGSIRDARIVAAFHNRAVLVDGIHSSYDTARLKALLDKTACGPCQSVSFIAPRGDLLKLAESRNGALKKFEKALQSLLNKALEDKTLLAELEGAAVVSLADRIRLLKTVCDPEFRADLRPTHAKDEASDEKIDSISFHYAELVRLEAELDEALLQYQKSNGQISDGPETDPAAAQDTPADRQRLLRDAISLTSPRQYLDVRHNLKDVQLATGHHKSMAMVVMQTPQTAAIIAAPAVPLSRRPFSLETSPAPAHEDVLWENVQLPRAVRKYRWLSGIALNVAINLAYSPFIGLLNTLCSLDKLTYWAPWLDEFVTQHSMVKAVFQGVLVPFVLNLAFALAPAYLKAIALFAGPPSKTGVNMFMIDSYGAFLFFQSFVVVTLAASVVDMLRETARGDWGSVVGRLKQTLPSKSSMFFNMFLQRMLISLPMSLLRPIPLLAHNAERKLKGRTAPRAIHDTGMPSEFDLGTDYPGSIIYSTQVLLAFMTFAPVNLVISGMFFVVAVMAYRYALCYAYQVKTESGGLYWRKVCNQLLLGLLLHHLFLIVHFSFRKSQVSMGLMVPPILALPLFSYFLHKAYSSRIEMVPQTGEQDEQVDALLDQLKAEQETMLRDYREHFHETQHVQEHRDAEFLPVKEVVRMESDLGRLEAVEEQVEEMEGGAYNEEITKLVTTNPYVNPVLFRKYYSFMFDPLLFPCLRHIERTTSG